MFSAFVQDFDSELSLKAEQELKKFRSGEGDDDEVFEAESGLYTAINEYLAAIGHPYFFL